MRLSIAILLALIPTAAVGLDPELLRAHKAAYNHLIGDLAIYRMQSKLCGSSRMGQVEAETRSILAEAGKKGLVSRDDAQGLLRLLEDQERKTSNSRCRSLPDAEDGFLRSQVRFTKIRVDIEAQLLKEGWK